MVEKQMVENEFEAFFYNSPVVKIILDSERKIHYINLIGQKYAGKPEAMLTGIRAGEALRCIHSADDPRGCGFGEECQHCGMRRIINETFEQNLSNYRQLVTLSLDAGGRMLLLSFYVSSIPLEIKGESLILLTLEDITDLKSTQQKLEHSEESQRLIIDTAFAAIIISDGDQIIYSNRRFGEVFGYPDEMVRNLPIQRLFPPADWEAIREHILWGLDYHRDHNGIKSDGTSLELEVRTRPFQYHDRPMQLTFMLDITRRKEVEDALRRSEERYALAQRAANIGSWDWNIETNALYWSERIEPMFGFGKGEFGGTYEAFLASVHPDDRDLLVESVNKALNEGAEYVIEHRIVWSDGTVHWVSEIGDVFRDGSGKPVRMMGIVQDISERREVADELRRRDLINSLAQYAIRLGTWEWEITEGVFHWSEQAAAIFGLKPEEQGRLYEGAVEMVLPEDRKQITKALQRAAQNHTDYHEIFRLLWPDGTVHWVESIGRMVPAEGGKSSRMVGAIQDITEHKLREESLKRDLALTQALARLSNMLISPRSSFKQVADLIIKYAQIITDSEHAFVQTRDSATGNMIGHAATEMSIKGCTMDDKSEDVIFPVSADGQYPSLWGYALNQHKGFFTNDPANHPSAQGIPKGHIGLKNYLAVPALMGSELMGQIAVANSSRDYTEDDLSAVTRLSELMALAAYRDRNETILRKRTIELEETSRELKRSNADLEQFAYAASHDLQEPLRMIANFLQLLERRYGGILDGDAHTFVDFAVDGAKRMQNLINDLLEFSRVGSRGKPFQPTDMNEIVADAIKNIRLMIEQNNATITTDALPEVIADRSQMVQLFQNLLTNAIKFHGINAPVIHITYKIENGMTIFGVMDNGIGIASEHKERIFGVFQRLHTREQYPGTGIGLAICERIVSRHGGKIWVESEEGKGSTFFFSIPLQQ